MHTDVGQLDKGIVMEHTSLSEATLGSLAEAESKAGTTVAKTTVATSRCCQPAGRQFVL